MSEKRDIIQDNAELCDLVWPAEDPVQLSAGVVQNDRYVGVGCDLRDTTDLSRVLEREVGTRLDSCLVLCVAEVSITYMDVPAADAVIKWTTQYKDGMSYRGNHGGQGCTKLTDCSKILSS